MRRRRPTNFLVEAASVLSLLACSPEDFVAVPDLSPGEALLLISVDDAASVHAVAWWEGTAERIEIPPDGALVGFRFPPEGLRDELGAALALSEVHLRAAETPTVHPESCGRCFALAETAPQFLRRGESCPVPPFAEAQVLQGALPPERLEALRARVRLEELSACPCDVEAVVTPPGDRDLELRPLSAQLGAWPVEALAVSSSRAIGLFGEHVAEVRSASGEAKAQRPGPSAFEGRVLAAAPASDDGFFVWMHDAGEGSNEQLLLELDANLRERAQWRPTLRVLTAAWFPEAKAHLQGGAEVVASDDVESLKLCPEDAPVDCVDLASILEGEGGAPTQMVSGPEGSVVVELYFRHILAFEGMPAPATLAEVERLGERHGTLVTGSGERRRWRIHAYPTELGNQAVSLLLHRGSVFACARGEATGAFALRLDDAFYRGDSSVAWSPLLGASEPCTGLGLLGDEIQLNLKSGTSLRCSAAALGECEPGPASALAGEPTGELQQVTPSLALSFGRNRVRARLTGQEAWQHLYGLPQPVAPVRALAASADRLLVAREDGALEWVELDSESVFARAGPKLPAPPLAADYAADRDEFLVSVDCAEGDGPELWRGRPGAESLVPIDLGGPGRCERILQLTSMGLGRFLLAADSGTLLVLEADGSTRPVSVQWDDPETPAAEGRPEALSWQNLHRVRGVVFASGLGPALVRIDALHDPYRAFGIFMGRATQANWNPIQPFNEPEPRGLAGRCPDVVKIGSRGRQRVNFETGLVWKLMPDQSRVLESGLAPLLVLDEPLNSLARGSLSNPSGIGVRAIVGGDADWTVMVMSNALHRVGASWRIRHSTATTSDVVELPGDRFVLGTENGDLFLGRRLPTE